MGDDHFLQMVVETPAGDTEWYQYDFSLKEFVCRMPLTSKLPENWNLGFIPSGVNHSHDYRLADVLLIGPQKAQGTILKVIPISLLYLNTKMGRALVVAVPADPADHPDGMENAEVFALENPTIFRNIEEKIALSLFQVNPENLSWADQTGAWHFISLKINNMKR